MERELLQFWGKTPKAGEPAERYHPAIYHMIDVACVAEALLRDGAPRLRGALLHAWDGVDPAALLAWLPFLIATHDLGKISAAFQGQGKNREAQAQRERLVRAGVTFGAGTALYHAEVSALWLHEHLRRREPGVASRTVWALRDAMGGHHGRFTQEDMRQIGARLRATERGEPRWAAWRDATYTQLRDALAPAGDLAAVGEPRHLRPATVALTGFLVWCDWMGSNERDFPASPDLPPDAYLAHARACAAAALAQHHLDARRPPTAYRGFGTLFPDPPRPLQALVDALPAETLAGPLLAVVEAPTGEGKTEAALALARRIAVQSGTDEIFFALPTMATGNQMFVRLEQFYRRHYGDGGAVRLTHSQAVVVEDELRRAALAPDSDLADRNGASAGAAIEWFAGPKKAMLAPFGVGTVDQVELAGLNVRHYPLRLFGLAGKVVVIDEIHAYDAYMSTILAHTLTWLARLGCSVVLLSATLPAARHHALAAAFLDGLSAAPPDLPAAPAYPQLAIYRAEGTRRETCAVFRGEQSFTLRLAPQRDPAAEARSLVDLVRDGGAVARLCNRVDDAQAIYRELLALLPADSRVLLHARFPLEARQRRERRIEELVGRQTERTPGQPLIIVGTQVLEQSLDYDVDVMVSDFAPIDLLLQRAGRLHRHRRVAPDGSSLRPPRHARPVLEVTLLCDADGRPDWRRWAPIYAPYILWRTWETLRDGMADDGREIVLPRDYRPLIEAVYGDDAAGDTRAAYADLLARDQARYEQATSEQQAQARRPLTPDALGSDAIIEGGAHDFIEDESGQAASWQLAKTRLGDRVTVVPVYRVGGQLALDPHGTCLISPDIPPPLDSRSGVSQKDMLARAVPLSERQIIAAYRDDARPRELRWPWRDIPPLLRGMHPLPLDRDHTARFDRRTARLDPDLGLVIEKRDPAGALVIEEDL